MQSARAESRQTTIADASTPEATLTRRTPSLGRHVAGLLAGRLFVVFWGGLVVIDLGLASGLPAPVTGGALVVLTAGCSWRQGWVGSVAVAAVSWLMVNGFVENAAGQLALTGRADLIWLLALFAPALLAGHRR